jgi:hypothetical protein
MAENEHTFNLVFALVGLFFAGIGIAGMIGAGHMVWLRRRTLAQGLSAEAVCLETYLKQERSEDGPTRTTRHAILGFRTHDGRDIRIDRTSGFTGTVGDFVPVRYLPERPDRAIAVGPGSSSGVVGAVIGMVFLAVFTCVGLSFAAVAFGLVGP